MVSPLPRVKPTCCQRCQPFLKSNLQTQINVKAESAVNSAQMPNATYKQTRCLLRLLAWPIQTDDTTKWRTFTDTFTDHTRGLDSKDTTKWRTFTDTFTDHTRGLDSKDTTKWRTFTDHTRGLDSKDTTKWRTFTDTFTDHTRGLDSKDTTKWRTFTDTFTDYTTGLETKRHYEVAHIHGPHERPRH